MVIATIPAALFGFFFDDIIENTLTSYFFLSITFFITGLILLGTKFFPLNNKNNKNKNLNYKNSLFIGLFQTLALFPGISRSGMTISTGLFSGIKKEKAVKFSFLLFIPLALGAVVLSFGDFYFSLSLAIAFIVCFLLSLLFLNLLYIIIRENFFWMFSIYCFLASIASFVLGVLN